MNVKHSNFSIYLGIAGSVISLVLFSRLSLLTTPVFKVVAAAQVLAVFGYIAINDLRKISIGLIWFGSVMLLLITAMGAITIGPLFLPAAALAFAGAVGVSMTNADMKRIFGISASVLAFLVPTMFMFLSLISGKWSWELILIFGAQLLGVVGYIFFWQYYRTRMIMIWWGAIAALAMYVLNVSLGNWLIIISILPVIAALIQSWSKIGYEKINPT